MQADTSCMHPMHAIPICLWQERQPLQPCASAHLRPASPWPAGHAPACGCALRTQTPRETWPRCAHSRSPGSSCQHRWGRPASGGPAVARDAPRLSLHGASCVQLLLPDVDRCTRGASRFLAAVPATRDADQCVLRFHASPTASVTRRQVLPMLLVNSCGN